jgi:hypothetical protein
MEINYEKDIWINDQELDIEWLEQPTKMFKYCSIAAQTRKELDQAKENVDVVKAGLDQAIRNNPGNFGLEKVTDKAIESVITTDKEYIKASNAYIQAKYENEMALAAVRACDQRKDALENLVRLHGQSYFAGPSETRDLKKERKRAVIIRKN